MDDPASHELAMFYARHAAGWSLVFVRVLGIFLFAPMLSGLSVPVRFRVMLAAMLSVGAYAAMEPAARALPDVSLVALAFMLFTEVLIGIGIGVLAGIPLIAVEAAGQIIGYQLGFGIARASNPDFNINLDAIGMMLFIITVMIFISVGGIETVISTLLGTFAAVPPGAVAVSSVPLEGYVELLTRACSLAVSLAGPVLGVVLVTLAAIGITGRLMPQMSIMSFGFAIKIIV